MEVGQSSNGRRCILEGETARSMKEMKNGRAMASHDKSVRLTDVSEVEGIKAPLEICKEIYDKGCRPKGFKGTTAIPMEEK